MPSSTRDKDATWRSTGTICRELDWRKRRLLYELENGLPYRTIPPGWTIDWSDDLVWPYFSIEASEISIGYGHVLAAIVPPSPKTYRELEAGVTLGIEVLPPGASADAEVPPSSADVPVTTPAPPKMVSEADLRKTVLAIEKDHPPGSPPLTDKKLHKKVEELLSVTVARDRVLGTRDEVAPHFKLPVGRPRKNAQ